MEKTLIQSLAAFAASVDLEKVPAEVPKQAKLCVLDTLGCILAGSISPDGQAFLRAELEMAGSDSAETYTLSVRLEYLPIGGIFSN